MSLIREGAPDLDAGYTAHVDPSGCLVIVDER